MKARIGGVGKQLVWSRSGGIISKAKHKALRQRGLTNSPPVAKRTLRNGTNEPSGLFKSEGREKTMMKKSHHIKEDAKGSLRKSKKGEKNSGLASANPVVLSGDGDATAETDIKDVKPRRGGPLGDSIGGKRQP